MNQAISPGYFGKTVCADSRRGEFDWRNQLVLDSGKKPDFIFIGDSITQLWELPVCFESTGLRLVNRGISGDEMQYISKRFSADVLQLQPRCCVLLGGINDSWNLDYNPPLQRMGESLESLVARVTSYFDEIISLSEKTNVKLAICSILPVEKVYQGEDGKRLKYIHRVNQYLQRRCQEKGLLYVDYYTAMIDKDSVSEVSDGALMTPGLTHEGLHPNSKGYAIMKEILCQKLAEIGLQL